MITVICKPLFHRGMECIGIYFERDPVVQKALKKTGIARYSATHNCWFAPWNIRNLEIIKRALSSCSELTISGVDRPGDSFLAPHVFRQDLPIARTIDNALFFSRQRKGTIHAINAHVLPLMKQRLILKAFSNSTQKTYLTEMRQLLQSLDDIPADQLTIENLERYLVYCLETLKLSENTLHSRINALKFYYEQVLGREKFFWQIPRPKKPMQLPKLLNEDEIGRLFNALTNRKHKAMLFTVYSAGLRVSELANLRLRDIDSKRMQIFIERAKGKKDRYVNLSPILLDILRQYFKNYSPRPKDYLFESEQTGTAYPIRTIQQIFSNAKKKAGIRKEVGIHSLRHSFATHLLEKGVDIRFIKEILGHFDIRTTERYLHVARQKLVNIISPLDDLFGRAKIDW